MAARHAANPQLAGRDSSMVSGYGLRRVGLMSLALLASGRVARIMFTYCAPSSAGVSEYGTYIEPHGHVGQFFCLFCQR